MTLTPLPSALSRDEFVAAYGAVYESSPWVAEAVWGAREALNDPQAMHVAMRAAVEGAGEDRQLALIRAHPELAHRAQGALGAHSAREQKSAGLDASTPEEAEALVSLNDAYSRKFGFPFIIAVAGLDRAAILAAFRRRIGNDQAAEFRTALDQIHRIARLRLDAMTAKPPAFAALTNLAQPRLGAEVVYATDDFFADKSRLIAPAEPVFIPGKYDENGKWMDGWESRRRRTAGHDYCIVRLGRPGAIEGFEIDTRHFTGNFPPAASIEACNSANRIPEDNALWTEIAPRIALEGDSKRLVAAQNSGVFTHVRLHIYPDGGVARLRVFGRVAANPSPAATIDLAALEWGARAVGANDEHFGRVENMLAPGRGADMGDGWETRRRRTPGYDFAIIELCCAGTIERVVVDTVHFKGNYPDRCSIQASADGGDGAAIMVASEAWPVILPPQKLEADREHLFTAEIVPHGPVRLVRLNIFPDGGVSRLRLFGRPAAGQQADAK
jgi:allantoicase